MHGVVSYLVKMLKTLVRFASWTTGGTALMPARAGKRRRILLSAGKCISMCLLCIVCHAECQLEMGVGNPAECQCGQEGDGISAGFTGNPSRPFQMVIWEEGAHC